MAFSNGTSVVLDKTNIAWPSDVNDKFKEPNGPLPSNWIKVANLPNVTDEDFIVWMRTAALPNFNKLKRRILTDLKAGTYTLTIGNCKY